MCCKYYLIWEEENCKKRLLVEDFGDAFVCEGRVFFRETAEHSINTLPGQCWGELIELPAGCFLDGERLKRATSVCIDDVGQSYVVTEIVSADPLSIKSVHHIGVDAFGEETKHSPLVAELGFELRYDKLCINGIVTPAPNLLIPAEINGLPVGKVDLSDADLSDVETLIISEGLGGVSIDFSTAKKLSRLVLPKDLQLNRPLDYISQTPWFKAQRPESIYFADCYCGTPGGGSGGNRCLIIPEGISHVAAGADFHSYWHSISLPESLCLIGRLAFATNHCLEELSLGEGLHRIDEGAFFQAERLKHLYLPDRLKKLGADCFGKLPLLESASVPSDKFAERFSPHSLTVRSEDGEKHLSKSPPIVVPLTDRIRAYPKGSAFSVKGKSYSNLDALTAYPLPKKPSSFLDVHGREIISIAVLDRCTRTDDGEYERVRRWFYKENGCVSQIEQVQADGTILVREDITPLDVPYVMRNYTGRLFKD